MAIVTITGGTGLIGSALSKALVGKGYHVIVLSRSAKPPEHGITYKQWDPVKGAMDESAVTEADFIVHLAGANVAEGRWTERRKKEIVNSRTKSGDLLVKVLRDVPNRVQAVLSASAIGWYGPDPVVPNPKPFVETDPPSGDFLGSTCVKWEAAIRPVEALGKRLVIFRTGIVLSNEGGAYAEFKKPLRFGVAGILGNGKQVVSWIHIDDLIGTYVDAIENEKWNGIYNAVAPVPVANGALVREMKRQKGGMGIPLHVPAFALKLGLGEMSVEVLKSTTVSAAKAESEGYAFRYPSIELAVKELKG